MKTYTVEEIENKVKEIWKSADFYDEEMTQPQVETTEFEVVVLDNRVDITISRMYNAPGLTFAQLKALGEFFQTENINDDDNFYQGGCPTCDYPSESGFTLTVRP